MKKTIIYSSGKNKSDLQADHYSKTHESSYRYLAYRDIPSILEKYLQKDGNEQVALDYGSGAGCSTNYLRELGFTVIGVDISKEMLSQARLSYPDLTIYQIEEGIIPLATSTCDLIFSSFVLFELGSQEEIVKYLLEAKRVMKKDGIFVAITGSQDLYHHSKKWLNIRVDFPENEKLFSGKSVKVFLHGLNMEFKDYYWTESDYINFFSLAGLQCREIHYPLGNKTDAYPWKDEITSSPFIILVAKFG